MPAGKTISSYRFSIFEVNPATGELLRQGVRVKLQEQPFRLLVFLLERSGRVVSRDELRGQLWPEDTFVEFDNSLNVAIRKLREALRDDADTPRFVETLPRRGYRFLAEVAVLDSGEIPIAEGRIPPAPPRSRRRRFGILLALGFAAVAAAIWVGFRVNRFGDPLLKASDRVVLADFQNVTGDPAFDGTLMPAFRLKLEESPYLTVVSQANLLKVVKAAGKNETGPLSLDEARAGCDGSAAKAVLYGVISPTRNGYLLKVGAQRCSDGKELATEQARPASPDQVLQSLGQVTMALRGRLGEPSASVSQFDKPVVQATTSSLAALKAFSLGEAKRAQGQDYETISNYKLAADLDPQFALAYGRLGATYSNSQEFELGKQYFQKAFDLRERATERERLYITTHYYSGVTGELEKTIEAYEIWRQLYPNDLAPANNLADMLISVGEPEKAIEPARDAVRIDPRNGFPYMELTQAYMRSGHFAEAKETSMQAVSQKLDGLLIHVLRFDIAFAENDEVEMQRQKEWARGNPREGEMLDAAGMAAFARGQVHEARDIFAHAAAIASKANLKEYAALVTLDEAQYEVEMGLVMQSRQDALAALVLAPNSNDVQVWASIVMARAGEIRRAEELASRVAAAEPLDTLTSRVELPAERALIRLSKKDPEGAIRELEVAKPYDLSRATALMTIYLRGVAYLEAGHPQEAAGEFQKVMDHRGVQPNSPYVPLAQLGLARAHAAANMSSARSDYSVFFQLWNHADSKTPILKEAKAEYAKLQ